MLVLKELAKLLRLLSDGSGLPLANCARWLSLKELGSTVVEASEEAGDTEGASATTLCVLLLSLSTETCNELYGRLVLVLEAEALALEAHFVDQHASICLESGEGEHKVLVDALDFADGAWVLKLGDGVLFDGEDDAVATDDSDGCTAAIDSLKGILDLEELAIRGEHSVRNIVAGHFSVVNDLQLLTNFY